MFKFFGYCVVNFVDGDGRRVNGLKLQMSESGDPNFVGEACYTPFISVSSPCYEKVKSLKFGEVNIEFGRKDRIIDIYNI